MAMVKLNRGPMHRKVFDDRTGYGVIIVDIPEEITFAAMMEHDFNPIMPYPSKRGEYRRSLAVTKKGLPIYEWMGYHGEIRN